MRFASRTIFVADDDPDDLQLIKESIEEQRPENKVEIFLNTQELLSALHQLAEGEQPALIVLDLNMPGKDGLSALIDIKSDPFFRLVPVVICTTSTSMKDKANSYASGANCFITKPNSFSQFSQLFGSILDLWIPRFSKTG